MFLVQIALENLTSLNVLFHFFPKIKRFLLHSGLVILDLPVLYVYIYSIYRAS